MASSGKWPKDVGILAIEVYIPSNYVEQTDLEEFDKVSAGKYTVGLGQNRMVFCNDREDVNSLCLTVVSNLLERYGISPNDIGRLEVGTETIIDKSKSTKTILMQLFGENSDLEGVDSTNACYGGTAALFNSVNWVESSAWDRRLALVVCADIAIYAKGAARPTGGAGAIAMLVGPNAPLIIERGVRSSYFSHAYDFYKPDLASEFPMVDGPLSIICYFSALDKAYNRYKEKSTKADGVKTVNTIADFDAILFHCPFTKMVRKSFARLAYNDYLALPEGERHMSVPQVTVEESFFNKEIEKTFMDVSKKQFEALTDSSLWLAKEVGNMYTPSLYGGLASYLHNKSADELYGNRLALFSYGSGLASTFYSIRIPEKAACSEKLEGLCRSLSSLKSRLESRTRRTPAEFEELIKTREPMNHDAPFTPTGSYDNFFPGTYYLTGIDGKYRRTYERIPPS